MTLPLGLKQEDQCPDCGGWHVSAPTLCKKCGKTYCALVYRDGLCFGCTLLSDEPVRCEINRMAEAPREGCSCAACVVWRIMTKNWKTP